MSDQTDRYISLVKPYGLSADESRLYLHLLKSGFQSALALSRQLGVGRTKVYRLLDKLKAQQLVEYRLDERGMKFGATHPSKFDQLLSHKEQEIQSLKTGLPELITELEKLMSGADANSKVLYYSGEEGLKQISYNITRSDGEVRVFEKSHLSDFTPTPFAEQVRQELVDNTIFVKNLTNNPKQDDFTQVTEMIRNHAAVRYIDPKKLKIKFETLIYNNVYATYSYADGELFGVEIYNSALAQMQKQLFDFVWEQAQPMRFTSDGGAAEVEE